MGFLTGKKILIAGIASNRSIAYGIAKAMFREGAELAFSYPNERFKPRVEKFAEEFESQIVLPCDVTIDDDITNLFSELNKTWDSLDALVHSIAFAPREALVGDYLENLDREAFRLAHDISSYSLSAMAKAARPMMQGTNGSIITMSYLGAEKALPNYNVMGVAKASLEASVRYLASALGPEGIRVNSISAGPIKTLAASGIGSFKKILDEVEHNAPLRRNVTIEDVGNTGAFLCSDMAAGITGENIYVDSGYNIMSMGVLES
ncbi:MAG: enoyl-ACP reductase [Gammaproteobacteria bacterium]|nr:enoyl-ACP reductase [Gammaproteobacteria bacterium]